MPLVPRSTQIPNQAGLSKASLQPHAGLNTMGSGTPANVLRGLGDLLGGGATMGRPMRASGGEVSEKMHVGPIHSAVAGRTDHLPMHVPHQSYVIPADIISAMGEGNTIAGFKHLRRMFAGNPYKQGKKPYGVTSAMPYGQGEGAYGGSPGPYGEAIQNRAAGGKTSGVPIVAAGGEQVLSPEDVLFAGDGDMDMGHRVLDEFVKRMRKKTIKTLQKLPGPKRD